MENFKFLYILAYLKYASVNIIPSKLTEVNITESNVTKYTHIHNLCNNRTVCQSNGPAVCVVRKIKDDFEYKNFENSCYLFLSNFCDNPGEEFSIVQGGDCAEYLKTRRMYVYSGVGITSTEPTEETNTHENEQQFLRGAKFSTLYDVASAFDDHPCPLRCPDVYSPICVSANRGLGKYMKFWTFVNHCSGDLYYCKHWLVCDCEDTRRNYPGKYTFHRFPSNPLLREKWLSVIRRVGWTQIRTPLDFQPPSEDLGERITTSKLPMSFCGSHRYMQFARFAESASAMGHYGWLSGDQRYSHIMEDGERKPAYG